MPTSHLPIVKAKGGKLSAMPDGEAVRKMFSVVTSPEVARYMKDRFAKLAEERRLTEKYQGVFEQMDAYIDLLEKQTISSTMTWKGQFQDASKFRIFHENMSQAAFDTLTEGMAESETSELNFAYAMSGNSELLQGFSDAQGNPLDTEMNEKLDDIYSNWLTSNSMLCRDGVIYYCDEDGDIITENNKDKAVPSEAYSNLFENAEKGFSKFVSERTRGKININVSKEQYPGEEKAIVADSSQSSTGHT